MAKAGRRLTTGPNEPTVHNEGPGAVRVQVVVDGDNVSIETVELEPGESHEIPARPGTRVEVHTGQGTATALVTRAPIFLVRDGRVLVAPD